MDFRYSQDQQDLIDAAKSVFDGENTLERLRGLVPEKADSSEQKVDLQMPLDLWRQFSELGLTGLMAPESDGGLAQPLVVMAGVAEAAGYVALPEPLIELAGIVVPLLSQTNDSQRTAKVVEGELSIGLISPLLPYINAAGYHQEIFVTSEVGGQIVSKESLDVASRQSIDPLRKLLRGETDSQQNALADLHGAVLSAAQLIGLSSRMVDMSVEYAKDRRQFGKAIGSFQAVKHQLATAYTQIEFTRPIIQLAALKGGVAVHNAKIAAIDAAILAAETAIQVHGGMGYTFEVDLHLFMKRAWAVSAEWGDKNYHMNKLEAYLLNSDAELGATQTFI